jgi:hypothetical protein
MPIPKKSNSSREERLSQCLQRVLAAESAIESARDLLLEACTGIYSSGFTSSNGTGAIDQSLPPNPRLEFQKSFGPLQTNSTFSDSPLPTSIAQPLIRAESQFLCIKSQTCTAALRPPGSEDVATESVDHRAQAIAAAKHWKISEDLAVKCMEAFRHADKDDSGTIEVSELRTLLEEVAGCTITDSEYRALLHKFDEDGSGNLDFDEFLQVFVNTPMQHVFQLEEKIGFVADDARQRMQLQRMDPSEIVHTIGIPRKDVKQFLRKELAEADACWAFPWAVALFVCFTVSVLLHMRIDRLYAIDKAISYDIVENANFAFSGNVPFETGRMGHKNIDDVNSHADFWSWFNMGLVPLVWAEGIDVNEVRTNAMYWCQGLKAKFLEFGWNSSLVGNLLNANTTGNSSACPEGKDVPHWNHDFLDKTPTYLLYHLLSEAYASAKSELNLRIVQLKSELTLDSALTTLDIGSNQN